MRIPPPQPIGDKLNNVAENNRDVIKKENKNAKNDADFVDELFRNVKYIALKGEVSYVNNIESVKILDEIEKIRSSNKARKVEWDIEPTKTFTYIHLIYLLKIKYLMTKYDFKCSIVLFDKMAEIRIKNVDEIVDSNISKIKKFLGEKVRFVIESEEAEKRSYIDFYNFVRTNEKISFALKTEMINGYFSIMNALYFVNLSNSSLMLTSDNEYKKIWTFISGDDDDVTPVIAAFNNVVGINNAEITSETKGFEGGSLSETDFYNDRYKEKINEIFNDSTNNNISFKNDIEKLIFTPYSECLNEDARIEFSEKSPYEKLKNIFNCLKI